MLVYILAGGLSRRMGRDKTLLTVKGKPLILSLYRKLSRFAPTFVITKKERVSVYRKLGIENLVEDLFEIQTPLVGILSGLKHSPFEKNLFFSADLPLLCEELVRFLANFPLREGKLGLVPKVGGKIHFTAAVYLKGLIPFLESAIERNRLSVKQFLYLFEVVEEKELLKEGITKECFFNLNTPEDWEKLKMLL